MSGTPTIDVLKLVQLWRTTLDDIANGRLEYLGDAVSAARAALAASPPTEDAQLAFEECAKIAEAEGRPIIANSIRALARTYAGHKP